ncbi:hypothetical protein Elgi_54840 [Paenibacillus elgii]|uniref:CPBP family intramembrane glutamic endopeptidase n=1 Tax=Paenibacillus elgii TaxID=189691 RepID=UPI002D7B5E04|nr:hypothetical protein Elgi_54840 [Paenibacillus elgii]
MQAVIGAAYTPAIILLMMWVPGIAAVVFTLLGKAPRPGMLGLRFCRPYDLIMAAAIPALTFVITAAGSALLFEGSIRWGDYKLMAVTNSFTLNLLVTILVVVAKSCLFALGEELGWRGYAQSRMIASFGSVKGIVILGIVWGYCIDAASMHRHIVLIRMVDSEIRLRMACCCGSRNNEYSL